MRKALIGMLAALTLAGCTTAENDAAVGGLAGAAIGGLATGRVGGAIVGGAAGAVAGVLIGRATRNGYCIYRDRRTGERYEARCRR